MCSVAPDPVNSINFCPKIKTFSQFNSKLFKSDDNRNMEYTPGKAS